MWKRFTSKPSRYTLCTALALGLLILCSNKQAHATGIDNAFQWWTPVYFDAPIVNPKVRLYLESNPRFADNMQGMTQHIARGAFGYRLRKNVEFYQGFAIISNFRRRYIQERRIYQQLGYGHVIRKRLQVFHRFRNEQRLIQTRNGTALRMRYMLRLAYPIRNTRYYLVGYDELFVNLNSLKGGPVSGIDQNRLFAGLGRQINKHLRAEIGYQWQYVNRREPFDDRAAHTLLTQLFINF